MAPQPPLGPPRPPTNRPWETAAVEEWLPLVPPPLALLPLALPPGPPPRQRKKPQVAEEGAAAAARSPLNRSLAPDLAVPRSECACTVRPTRLRAPESRRFTVRGPHHVDPSRRHGGVGLGSFEG